MTTPRRPRAENDQSDEPTKPRKAAKPKNATESAAGAPEATPEAKPAKATKAATPKKAATPRKASVAAKPPEKPTVKAKVTDSEGTPPTFSDSALTASGAPGQDDVTSTPRTSRGKTAGRATAAERLAAMRASEERVLADQAERVHAVEIAAGLAPTPDEEAAKAARLARVEDAARARAEARAEAVEREARAAALERIDREEKQARAQVKSYLESEEKTARERLLAKIAAEEEAARLEAKARLASEVEGARAEAQKRLAAAEEAARREAFELAKAEAEERLRIESIERAMGQAIERVRHEAAELAAADRAMEALTDAPADAVGRAGVSDPLFNAPTSQYAMVPARPDDPISVPPAIPDVPEPVEPVKRGPLARRIGRLVRVFSGVDERLLDQVPQERPRYTGLGGVVLGTATIAAFSMWFAIGESLGTASWWLLAPVVIWFLFILNFDRWLVSAAMVGKLRKVIPTLLMRMTMAVFFGVIIAEPLVLRVFQTAIEQHIRDQREQELADLRTKLIDCNPLTDVAGATPPTGCDGYLLSFSGTPGAGVAELTSLKAQADALQKTIDTDTANLNRINDEARKECVGDSGPGLSGNAGVGPNCKRLRDEADAYAAAHPIAANNTHLLELRNRISDLEQSVNASRSGFEAERDKQVTERVTEAKSHQGNIGILERMGALSELADSSSTLAAGTWAVRLFFILIDCMPVLVKFLGGQTSYDRVVARQLELSERKFGAHVETLNEQLAAEAHRRRAEIQMEQREHSADLELRLGRAVDRLEAEWSGSGPSAPAPPKAPSGTGRSR